MDCSIIIVSFNTKAFLARCLESLFKKLKKNTFEVIVIDNESSDGSAEMVKKNFPKVNFIQNKKNLGFGEANNLAAKKALGKYLVFLNPDTYLLDDSFFSAIDFMKKNKGIGILGPKILLEDRQTIQPYSFGFEPNFLSLIYERFSPSDDIKIKEVGWVTGACLFIRADLFNAIGGFDRRFFMYFEDIDLCMEARKRGFKVYFYPKTKIVHLLGKSLTKNLERKKIYWTSQKKFYQKHYGAVGLISATLLNLPRDLYLRLKHA